MASSLHVSDRSSMEALDEMLLPYPTGNTSTAFSRIGRICGLEEMVVGRSDLLQSPSELMLGKGGFELLLQGRAAHNMFDEISPLDVVWDDGLMHGLDCREELEQQEVLFDECLNVDSTAAVDLLTLLTHGNETFLKEVDMEAANNLFSSMQHEVVWDEEMPSDIGTHEIVVLTPIRTSGLLKQGINIADQVFGDCPSKVVVWDEELFHDLDSNDGLLQQLAQSGDYIGPTLTGAATPRLEF